MNSKKSCALIMIGASLWGGIGVFFNMLSDVGFTQMQVVAIRVTAAAVALTLYLLATDRAKLRVKLRDCWCFVGTGIVSLVFFNWCYFTAIQMTSLAVAAVLLYTSPIFVMLFSAVLFHEALTPRKLVALVVTFIGCVFVAGVFGGENAYSPLGIFIGICSGVGYALYSIFGRFALEKGYSSVTISEYTFVFATISAVPLSMIWQAAPLLAQPQTLVGALGIGVLCCVFPFILYTQGLAGVETGKAAILATMEPAVAAVLSFLLYRESLFNLKGVGILLIFAAVAMLNQPAKKKAA
ncbi:MAG TPA: DMT family transporter [Candidatus Anaerotruncus excrementipullorum]|uniref:DMT family transporter n=1 Tax=Candidatus Anaerotruncus excrementipullorum TaxID=2838465 RepID=A0A9D1WSP7_9FIRM|nr:DMT family transporter [Candidatus Anaerotruncus excrementipullorum]